MPKKILGSGWRFPISLEWNKDSAETANVQFVSMADWNKEIAVSKHEKKIEESIIIILSTAKGERVMRPEFGCGIHDFVFSVINTGNLTQIRAEVKHALIMWEPRIEVKSVRAAVKRLNEGIVDVNIDYRIRYTNTHHNMVYPFYLETR